MNISPNSTRILRKIEKKTGKDNLLGSKYLMLRKEVPKLDYGLFSYYIRFISGIEYALAHDMIPVVDMLNFRSSLHEEGEVGKINAWELFFEQPCGVGVPEALQSQSARYIWYDNPDYHPNDSLDFLYNDDLVAYYHQIQKQYLRIKPELLAEYEKKCDEMFHGRRVIGVLARGTDYAEFKPWFHPVQPAPDKMIPYIRECMDKYDCSHIFLATEDASILEQFQREFGDKLLYIEQKRLAGSNCWLHENKEWMSISPYTRTRDYLGVIYALSKCNGFVAGRTSGAVGAMLMSDGYEFKRIYTYGRYGVDDIIVGRVSNDKKWG